MAGLKETVKSYDSRETDLKKLIQEKHDLVESSLLEVKILRDKLNSLTDELDSREREFSEQFAELECSREKNRLIEEESKNIISDYVEKMNLMSEHLQHFESLAHSRLLEIEQKSFETGMLMLKLSIAYMELERRSCVAI